MCSYVEQIREVLLKAFIVLMRSFSVKCYIFQSEVDSQVKSFEIVGKNVSLNPQQVRYVFFQED